MYHLNFSCNVTAGTVRPSAEERGQIGRLQMAGNFHRCRVSLLSGGKRYGRQHSELRGLRDWRRTENSEQDRQG